MMTADCAASAAPDICPEIDQCHSQILAALPRGRAWTTPQGTTRWSFWRAIAAVIAYANERICAALNEFFCATHVETDDVWMAQYGLPDGCDPYPDLCAKVGATGGATCAWIAERAAAAGWDIECVTRECGAEADCGEADCAEAAPSSRAGRLLILVSAGSLALPSIAGTNTEADALEASQFITCAGDIGPLRCLIDRIAPAHLVVDYVLTDTDALS